MRAELSASVVEHWEQQTRLSIRIQELEEELRYVRALSHYHTADSTCSSVARAHSEESAMQTHTELATKDREMCASSHHVCSNGHASLSLRTELNTTVKLEAEHRQQSTQIERLEAEKRCVFFLSPLLKHLYL